MKFISTICSAAVILSLAACSSGGSKKVVVMANGKFTFKDNVVTLEPGSAHKEEVVNVTADKISVKGPDGSKDFPIAENGTYILNLKKDTVVGSYQRIGEGGGGQTVKREELPAKIDSLTQLTQGKNVSEAAKNYCIAPQQLTRLSTNSAAEVIGPFRTMPSSFDAGKEHEVYKFYTNKEVGEVIGKMKGMVDSDKKASEQ